MISVCIPCYNGTRHLEVAVESILAQTHGDFEVIIVDDASTDGTLELAQRLATGDARIRVHRNEANLGLVPNWNRCVELARGEWIKFVFQDDFLAPACLERMLETARRTKRKMVFCEREILIEPGVDPQLAKYFREELKRLSDVLPGRSDVTAETVCVAVLSNTRSNFFGEPTAVMLHRSLFFEYGVFDRQLSQVCDLEYWCRVGCHEGVGYVPERLATFRVHVGGTTIVNSTTPLKAFRRDCLDWVALHVTFLVGPLFEPLRRAQPGAVAELRRWFRQSLRMAEEHIAGTTDPNSVRVLESAWRAINELNPGIDLLRDVVDPTWRRNLRRFRPRKRVRPAEPRSGA